MSKGLRIRRGGRRNTIVGSIDLPPGTKDATLPRQPLPEGVVPLHATLRGDGLAVDRSIESYAFKRWSPTSWNPFRARWPEVHALDARVARLEERHTDMHAELVALREQLVVASTNDRDALAAWVEDPSEPRPLPAAPALEQRIVELEHERDALETAMQKVLDEKAEFVVRHRPRLLSAAKDRRDLVERLRQTIEAVATARGDVVACVEAERWAAEFPGPEADAGSLRLAMISGGRVVKAIPELKGQLAAVQVLEVLRTDSKRLNEVAAPQQQAQDEMDPHHTAIWEGTPEGRAANALADRRVRQGLAPRNLHRAGWED